MTALRWALSAAPEWGPVTPVAVWRRPWWQSIVTGDNSPLAGASHGPAVGAALDEMLANADLDDHQRGRLAEPIVLEGHTADCLLGLAPGFDLLVLGTRARSAMVDTVLGSTSVRCASGSTRPVAVVPETPTDPSGPVVVGVDGSSQSVAALRWAVSHTSNDTPIVAIAAWTLLAGPHWLDVSPQQHPSRDEVRLVAESAIVEATANSPAAAARVQLDLVQNDPRAALYVAGRDASMLVLGARGRTGWSHALVGSTTTALMHQPPCPTVVVPDA